MKKSQKQTKGTTFLDSYLRLVAQKISEIGTINISPSPAIRVTTLTINIKQTRIAKHKSILSLASLYYDSTIKDLSKF